LATLVPAHKPHRFIRASERIRTPDPLITNQPLYLLSYAGTILFRKISPENVEILWKKEKKRKEFKKFLHFLLENLFKLVKKEIKIYSQNATSKSAFCQEDLKNIPIAPLNGFILP
jgi:hypothetical protein